MRGDLFALASQAKCQTALSVQATHADILAAHTPLTRRTTARFNGFYFADAKVSATAKHFGSPRRDTARVLDMQYYLRTEYFRPYTHITDTDTTLTLNAQWLSDFLTAKMQPVRIQSTAATPQSIQTRLLHNMAQMNYFGPSLYDQTAALSNMPYEVLVDEHTVLESQVFHIFEGHFFDDLIEQLTS
jgi:hypothetical protein